MHRDLTTSQGAAQGGPFQLPNTISEADCVIPGDHPLVFEREHQVEIFRRSRHKSGAAFAGRLTETLIELGAILLVKKPVGLLQSIEFPRTQFLGQTSLPS